MSRVELVIFDCDGVLVDSERLSVEIEVAVLGELGWQLTAAEVVERFMGRPAAEMHAEIQVELGPSLPPGWKARFEARYREVFETELATVPDVIEALDRIDVPVCVASSGSHEWMRYTLGLTGLYDRFAGRIFSADDVDRGKPAPDVFLHAAASMGARPPACVVVEDSRSGVEAARAAGMRVLAFAGGLTPAAALEGPDTILFSHMWELPALVERLRDREEETH